MSDSLKERYERLKVRRQPFLDRARKFATLTIPSLLPPNGHRYTSNLPDPCQSFGARATTSLAARLLTGLMPAGSSSFRLKVPAATLIKSNSLFPPPEVEKGLVLSEKLINAEIESRNWRQPTSLSLQLLIVTGNALEQILDDNSIRVFRLDQYVVQRDHAGNVLEVIIEEKLAYDALPQEAKEMIGPRQADNGQDDVSLLTCYRRTKDGSYDAWQEVEDQPVPGSKGVYKTLPVLPLRWAIVPGESYGRGKIEEHYGDFVALEGLTKSLIDGAAMASRHVTMVRPNAAGGNLRQRIAKANNGDVLSGNPEDVQMLQFANAAGLQIAQQEVQRLTQQLSYSFLMVGDLRRDAERVTATELRMLAEELEGALGGVYSLLAQEMQSARLKRLIIQMQSKGQLPEWEGDMVDTQITTGLEALGREQDVMRVQQAGALIQGFGQAALPYVNFPNMLNKAFNGLGLADCVKSEQEVQQEMQQQMAAQALTQAAGDTMSAAGQAAVQGEVQ